MPSRPWGQGGGGPFCPCHQRRPGPAGQLRCRAEQWQRQLFRAGKRLPAESEHCLRHLLRHILSQPRHQVVGIRRPEPGRSLGGKPCLQRMPQVRPLFGLGHGQRQPPGPCGRLRAGLYHGQVRQVSRCHRHPGHGHRHLRQSCEQAGQRGVRQHHNGGERHLRRGAVSHGQGPGQRLRQLHQRLLPLQRPGKQRHLAADLYDSHLGIRRNGAVRHLSRHQRRNPQRLRHADHHELGQPQQAPGLYLWHCQQRNPLRGLSRHHPDRIQPHGLQFSGLPQPDQPETRQL